MTFRKIVQRTDLYRANLPVFEALYKSVKDGSETRRSLEFNSRKTYREDLQKELDEIDNQEIWRAGKTVRGLRVSLVNARTVAEADLCKLARRQQRRPLNRLFYPLSSHCSLFPPPSIPFLTPNPA